MQETYSINSKVENGMLTYNKNKVSKAIADLEGKDIEIIIKRRYRRRSIPQNSYYWGVVVGLWRELIAEEWGEDYSSVEMHEFLKRKCNYKEALTKQGEIVKIPKTTADLTTFQFEEYQERCRRLAFEYFNAIIPMPNEIIEIDFNV